jgi:general secretion pathway protein D
MKTHRPGQAAKTPLGRICRPATLTFAILLLAGCAAGRNSFNEGRQAELEKDYERALGYYQEALAQEPGQTEYQLKVEQMRFSAAFEHFEEGRRAMERGEYDFARGEFLRAGELDPSHDLARDELARVEELIETGAPQVPETRSDFEVRNDQFRVDPDPGLRLSPAVEGPLDLVMNQDAVTIYESIGALTGLNILFDGNFVNATANQTLSVTIDNMTVYEALDLVALLSNSFWVPVSQTTVMVAPNNTQARANYEQRIMKTIYLENSTNPTDLTEIQAALRTLLQINGIAQMTTQNAIMIVDTPDRVAVAEQIVRAFDLAKPEVLVEARVLEVDRVRLRELGVLPGTGTSIGVDPDVISTAPFVNLRNLDNLNSGSFNLVIPEAVAQFLENDSHTRLVQNPSVRSSDGVVASIRIGSRVPVASGSFQPAFVGATGTPVVQFQYVDVGVNLDITPRVLRNREVSMTVQVQVAATAGQVDLGGVTQPIFSNRQINHEIRLREGETNVLGGLISNQETTTINGLPGLSKIPVLGRLFSNESLKEEQTEIIVLLTPHIVRMPNIDDQTLRGIMVGTQNDLRFRGDPAGSGEGPIARLDSPDGTASQPLVVQAQAAPAPEPASPELDLFDVEADGNGTLQLRMTADNLAGADLVIEFNPASVELRGISEGGLLSRDGTAVTLVQSIDYERGIVNVSLNRPLDAPGISGEGSILNLKVEGAGSDGSGVRVGEIRIRPGNAAPGSETASVLTSP